MDEQRIQRMIKQQVDAAIAEFASTLTLTVGVDNFDQRLIVKVESEEHGLEISSSVYLSSLTGF